MTVSEMHQANRIGWNEGAEAYEAVVERDIEFLRNGGKNLEPPELRYLVDLSSWCGRAVHLQCAGGRDTLSVWNQGAREVVGVDISERMLDCARRKSEALGAPARWIHSDVLETPEELNGTADLVYTGRGALCWIQDLEAWAGVPARLLKPGGRLYIYEGHPICWIWDMGASEPRLDAVYGDYFCAEVMKGQGWPETYIGDLGKPSEEHAFKYERQWNLGQVVTTLVRAGLVVEALEEHPDPFWEAFPNWPKDVLRRIPQTYSLLMRKPE
jgi:SAM-dependent methyltransferase